MPLEIVRSFRGDLRTRSLIAGITSLETLASRQYNIIRCNVRELGRIVAHNVISLSLDPRLTHSFASTSSTNNILQPLDKSNALGSIAMPTFRLPRSSRAIFPGNLLFFSSCLPQSIPNKNAGYIVRGPNPDFGDRVSAVKVLTRMFPLDFTFN